MDRARALDAAATIASTSWGSYQVLGTLFPEALGTNDLDAAAAVAAFDGDPAGTSDKLLTAWLLANDKAVAAAKAGDVEEFVSRYNGCQGDGCAGYVAKFKAALAQFDAGTLKP